MKEFDKIIGYSSIKKELEQIADIFKNKEKYQALGVTPPMGVLLHGVPGVGKTSMAQALIKAIHLKSFICRKDKPNGDFIKHIKKTFDNAIAEAPSIVFLDDMDKFANGDERHPDSEEYVTVQSCIDRAKGKNIFVVATANNLHCLPSSLLRAGRFDRVIHIGTPNRNDAEMITRYYLSTKKVSADLDYKSIASIMHGYSCAVLETVINEAGIYAGFDGAESIEMQHFLKAAMRILFKASAEALEETVNCDAPSKTQMMIAYHEAGHALIHELLSPGSVALVSMYGSQKSNAGGHTVCASDEDTDLYKSYEERILTNLAGMAAIEHKFGISDIGNSSDLEDAFNIVHDMVVENCSSGFYLHGNYYGSSDTLRANQEQAVAVEIEKYYRRVKALINSNNVFFENIANELLNKRILCSNDIAKIKQASLLN